MPKLIDLFNANIDLLSDSERHVLYTLENLSTQQYQQLTLVQLSQLASVSTTTVIRMCHKLSFDGFSELKYRLLSLPSTIHSDTSFFSQIETLKSLQSHYDDIANLIIKASKVMIVGVGLSKPIAEYLSKLLLQTGKDSSYMYDSHILALLPQSVKNDHLIIYISSSGQTKTILDVATQLYHKHCQTVAITNQLSGKLKQYCNLYLSTSVLNQQINHFDVTPRSYLMLVIDLIFQSYLKQTQ